MKTIKWWLYKLICWALDADAIGNVASDCIEEVDSVMFRYRKSDRREE